METQLPSPVQFDQIRPFKNQVGGHSLMFKLEDKIFKSLIPNEHLFYSTVYDKKLERFIAKYYGTVDLQSSRINKALNRSPSQNLAVSWNDSILEKYMSSHHEVENHFIILQDLTFDFKKPCILDIKMGTRIHGLDAPEEKKLHQIKKCQQTTSSLVGIRICGSKNWNIKTSTCVQQDKYEGRRVRKHELLAKMSEFFFDGLSLRIDIVKAIRKELTVLYEYLREQNKYIFYSTSLLLIYDSDPEICKIRIRMVDFAHTHFQDENPVEDDSGFLFGLENLIDLLEKITSNE